MTFPTLTLCAAPPPSPPRYMMEMSRSLHCVASLGRGSVGVVDNGVSLTMEFLAARGLSVEVGEGGGRRLGGRRLGGPQGGGWGGKGCEKGNWRRGRRGLGGRGGGGLGGHGGEEGGKPWVRSRWS